MTEPKNPTPEAQNSPELRTLRKLIQQTLTGFFDRVRRKFKPEEEPVHPSEAAEIVIMDEGER
jgi:hypothetical protein